MGDFGAAPWNKVAVRSAAKPAAKPAGKVHQMSKRVLEEATGHLERSLGEKKEKLENHETKTAEMNEEIKNLKEESEDLKSKLKVYEALVVPFQELTEKLEGMKGGISLLDGQNVKLTDEIPKVKKENEILQTKARQFEEIKKMMEGI